MRRFAFALALLLVACGGGGSVDAGAGDLGAAIDAGADLGELGPIDAGTSMDLGADMPDLGPVPTATAWVVTSDFLAHTLTVWNRDALIDGVSLADRAVVFSIDLAAYPPGPLEHAITPDGRLAVVAVGPGFLDTSIGALVGATSVPPGGTLLIVDLVTRMVTHEVHTTDVPMSVAITPDGTRAVIACFGTSTARGRHIAVISLPDGAVVADVDAGELPEQIELTPDGMLGVVNLDGPGTAVTFDPADVAGTLSSAVLVGGDPDEAAFVAGTHFAVMARSIGPSGLSVLDLTDVAHPAIAATLDFDGVPYGVTAIPGTQDVLLPIGGARGVAGLATVHVDATGTPTMDAPIPIPTHQFSVPTHAALDADGAHAYAAMTGDGALAVVTLSGTARSIPWAGRVGPTWVTISPVAH